MAEEIFSKVSDRFRSAVDAGDVFFYPSTLHVYQEGLEEV